MWENARGLTKIFGPFMGLFMLLMTALCGLSIMTNTNFYGGVVILGILLFMVFGLLSLWDGRHN